MQMSKIPDKTRQYTDLSEIGVNTTNAIVPREQTEAYVGNVMSGIIYDSMRPPVLVLGLRMRRRNSVINHRSSRHLFSRIVAMASMDGS
jgi:hypothetical protein